ncbi:MAG: ParB/RepB/Spo0J family partition protein [Candidatus Omnitrophota bacterium]|nr:MAG: ParB/RepB/Spo0J family partition protein [Candidatus Omnitrophota bacterium]
MEKRVLGKGLDILIPKKPASLYPKEFTYLPLAKIKPGSYQPRQDIDPKELEELSRSIKEKGFIQPIVVRRVGDDYEIVAGGRRYQSAKLLGLKEIPTIIKELDDKDALIYAIIENLQRKDLNPVEEAEALKRLMDEFAFNLEDVARFVGKDKSTIANALRLLKLPAQIKQALRKGVITRTQARTILGVEKREDQENLFRTIIKESLSVREIEKRARKLAKKKRNLDPFVVEAEEQMQKILGTKVRIFNKRNNRGRIVIEYYNLDDLERIAERLR